MSIPAYKVNVPIVVTYQAAAAATGKTIAMNIFDETQTAGTTATFDSSAMAEIDATGRYRDTFTPDSEGDWSVQMFDSVGNTGKVVKQYQVVGHDIDDVGDQIDLVKVATDLLPTDPADQSLVEAAITASEANVIAEVDALESPAMVG